MAFYVIDDKNNKHEAYTKEEFLSLLEQIIEDESLAGVTAESGFITKFLNKVDGNTYGIAFCTQAEYNEMEQGGTLENNVIYYITDDDTFEALQELVEGLQENVEQLDDDVTTLDGKVDGLLNGTTKAKKAEEADKTKEALTIYDEEGQTTTFDGSTAQSISIDSFMGLNDAKDRTFVVGDEGFISFNDSGVGRMCLGYFKIESLSYQIYLGEINGVGYRIDTNGKLQQYVGNNWSNISSSVYVAVRWINKG